MNLPRKEKCNLKPRRGRTETVFGGLLCSLIGFYGALAFIDLRNDGVDGAGVVALFLCLLLGYGLSGRIVCARHPDLLNGRGFSAHLLGASLGAWLLLFLGTLLPWAWKIAFLLPFFLLILPWASRLLSRAFLSKNGTALQGKFAPYWFYAGGLITITVLSGFIIVGLIIAPFVIGLLIWEHARMIEQAAGLIDTE